MELTKERRELAIKRVMARLDGEYFDFGLHDQDELNVIKEAMDVLITLDKLASAYDHMWDMYADEFEDA